MSIRPEKIASVIQKTLGYIFTKYLPKSGSLVTIVHTDVSRDLSRANVFLSIIGDKVAQNEVLQYLSNHASLIRKELAKLVRYQFKRVPQVFFFLDNLAETSHHIDSLIEKSKLKNGNV